jgi:hypothetical protein
MAGLLAMTLRLDFIKAVIASEAKQSPILDDNALFYDFFCIIFDAASMESTIC